MKHFFVNNWRGVLISTLLLLLFTLGLVSVTAADSSALIDANDMLLVWLGNGASAGQQSAASPGQLVWMDASGAVQPLMDVPPQTSRV